MTKKKLIDVEEAKSVAIDFAESMGSSDQFVADLSDIFDQFASEKETCESCGGKGEIASDDFTETCDMVICPSCHGTGTKPDPVLEILQRLEKIFVRAVIDNEAENDTPTMALLRIRKTINVVREEYLNDQQRKKELGE